MKRTEVELSARMQALTDLVTPGNIVCDVGCDHGFVSIYLIQKNIAEKVYAMDVRSGPLSRAREHIAEYGLEDKIQIRLSDGLQNLEKGEATCMVCAGMGGPLMKKILQEGHEKAAAMKELILQPQSELPQFREYLRSAGFRIVKEDMVYEDGKYYPMMKVVPEGRAEAGAEIPEDQVLFDAFGPCLLQYKHPVLKRYLEHSVSFMEELQGKLKGQQSERAHVRSLEMEAELDLIKRALRYFEDSYVRY